MSDKINTDGTICSVYSEFDNQEVYCPYCRLAQSEHPINMLMGTEGSTEWECDECGKEFILTSTHYVEYMTSK